MKKILMTGVLGAALALPSFAQTLFTYGNKPVTTDEFLRVYKKNNVGQTDYSEKALRDYIDLYSLFRMKVAEAEAIHLDTAASVASEIDNYRHQLAKSYLTDEEMATRMVQEAYDRSKYEVRAAHILLLASNGRDTAAMRKLADSIYTAVTKHKADFGALAKKYSEDKGSKDNGGDVGYFTALQTVYEFENAAYKTPVGKVCPPFKTSFGYHIVKVTDKRPNRGTLRVAQILITTPKAAGPAGEQIAKSRVDSLETDLKKGVPFKQLVHRYSDDKFSIDKDGELPVFGVGRMNPDFDAAAFDLKKPGDISKPVKTEYGYHVIQLLEKYPMKPFDSVKKELKAKVDNDSRAQKARDLYFEKVKQENNFKEDAVSWRTFTSQLNRIEDTGKNAGLYKREMFSETSENTLFSLGGKNYTQGDFVAFAENTTRGRMLSNGADKAGMFRELYNMYVAKVVSDFQEHKLVEENPEFRNLMREYKDGIMLFELMDRNVWGKATKDTVGLKAFYESHKQNYLWQPGFNGVMYRFKNEAVMKEGMKLLSKNPNYDKEQLIAALNKEKHRDAVGVVSGYYEFSKTPDFPKEKLAVGKFSEPVKSKTSDQYAVMYVTRIYDKPTPKAFEDARGYAVSAYQDFLEQNWNTTLRAKYPVVINEPELKKIAKN